MPGIIHSKNSPAQDQSDRYPLFSELISAHPGLAEELAAMHAPGTESGPGGTNHVGKQMLNADVMPMTKEEIKDISIAAGSTGVHQVWFTRAEVNKIIHAVEARYSRKAET